MAKRAASSMPRLVEPRASPPPTRRDGLPASRPKLDVAGARTSAEQFISAGAGKASTSSRRNRWRSICHPARRGFSRLPVGATKPSAHVGSTTRRQARCRTSAGSGVPPAPTFTRLARDVSPLTRCTRDFGTSSRSARKASRQALALPSTGGAARRIFSASPCRPTTSVLRRAGLDVQRQNDAIRPPGAASSHAHAEGRAAQAAEHHQHHLQQQQQDQRRQVDAAERRNHPLERREQGRASG